MTELNWEGKYKDGKKTAPVRIALPFQTIETVNESTEDRKKNLNLFAANKQTEWRNRLIWGDKKYVLPSLLEEFAGKVNLIYIDPPFDTGADFSFRVTIPDNPETDEDEETEFIKEPSIIEQKAYRDTWGKGLDSYLQWFYETLILLRELLTDNGSIYVHLDWHVGHYAKLVLDEVFGYNNFLNEIIWCYKEREMSKTQWNKKHDVIYYFAKNEGTQTFNYKDVLEEYTAITKAKFKYKDEKGYYQIRGKGTPGSPVYKADGLRPEHEIKYPGLTYRQYIQEGTLPRDWWTISIINKAANERVEYATQKPEGILERIIKASSNENDIILDCFCGSGTTASVAEKLNRRWITCDLGRFAIHTTRKRLLQIPNVKPFVVQNLGKYERQAWATEEFDDPKDRAHTEKSYRDFIVELYKGNPVENFVWLHGIKNGRMIHVGNVEAPVSLGDVKSIIQEFWKSVGKKTSDSEKVRYNGIDVLGWEFAFDINETAIQQAAANKVDMKFRKIPREVLEKKAVEQGDIKFFELAALEVKAKTSGVNTELALKDFVVPPDDVPEDVRKAITHWSQWIDYWAVDWNYKDDTFHNEWQSYRTKKDPKIELSAKHKYEEKGKYNIVVKVIDILGNDTTKLIEVNIK